MSVAASPERRSLAGRIARASNRFGDTKEDVTALKRELKAQIIEDHIRALVDSAPPLTTEQREKLALLLRGSKPGTNAYDVLDSVPTPAVGIKEQPGTHAATRPE